MIHASPVLVLTLPVLRIQRYSSYVFFVFTTCHFITTSLVPLAARSVRASESYFLLTRELYQTPLSEPLLVFLPAAAHVASGLALRLLRRSQNLQRYGGATPGMVALHRVKTAAASSSFSSASSSSSATALLPTPAWPWPPFSTIAASGYALALFLGAHVALNRALPLLVDGDSANVGLAYVAHGFARHPALAGAAYVGLLGAGAGHMVWGWARWVGVAQRAGWWNTRGQDATGYRAVDRARTRARRRNFLLVNGVAVAVAVAWAAGGLGVVARGGAQAGWLGKAYDDLFQRLPFL